MLKAPVYTIALGDTIPKKDILINAVNVNDLVYLDNDFRMEIQVQAFQCDGTSIQLTVLEDGKKETVFEGLSDPFYSVDSRDYQVVEPNHTKLRKMSARILAIEKNRPHVPYERAIMAVRFTDHFLGTQFHPEADAVGMSMYLQREDKKQTVIENHGEPKWQSMVEQLRDPEKIMWTYEHVLPNFLNLAVGELVEG